MAGVEWVSELPSGTKAAPGKLLEIRQETSIYQTLNSYNEGTSYKYWYLLFT